MNSFAISDVLNYAECPSRFLYPIDRNLFDTRESISAYIVSNLYKFILQESSKKKFPTLEVLNKQLNILWDKIKKNITFSVSSNDFIIFQSFSKRLLLNIVSSFSRMEVIVHDQIFEYSIKDKIIQIPLSVIRSVSDIYVFYIDQDVFYQDTPVGYQFLGPIVHRLGKIICSGHRYKMCPVIYRSQSLRTYQCIDNSRVDEALENITNGMGLGIYYPRVAQLSCKLCRSKQSCKWYESTKTN